ncbi:MULTISPECIES: gliding motility-associated C-terminal domain-containing protein [Flavobacterium]|uniref:Gliding motility-associated C-terminal domain-containing protein n=1 Tax=Flavobacterium keumense TaxID=1306518 RepID=A0ABY8N605_9FLAO|nr:MULTISPECIES: gliding motility-associated C-terminal domain-containing protein [Flavobacterium]WGK95080.1 gliding motility-associated C-terminal domain-containing protein [Flavobacterium keumense]
MKNIFFNWNKLLRKDLFLSYLLLFMVQINYSQCTITSFTVAKTNATCFSNGEIKVSIPTGQSGCETRFATLVPVTGTSNIPVPSQTQTLTFSSTGGDVVFGSLPAGKYNVATSDGITTTNYTNNPVTITSSYTPMTLTLSSTAPTCTLTSSGYTQNGTFTTTITGGTGPFDYTLTSAFGVQTVSSSSRTQVFNNIKAGENVTILVTDKVNGNVGCQVSVTQNYVTSTAVPAALDYGTRPYNFIRDCSDPNQSKIKFYINLSNLTAARLALLQQPGNAKITIAGVDYPLTYVAIRNGFMYDPVAVNGPQLVNGMTIKTSFNWECGTLTRTSPVVMPDNYFNYYTRTNVATDCSLKLQFVIFGDQDNTQGGYVDRHIYFCPNNTVEIAKRISTNPDVYQVLSGSDISPDPALTSNDLNVTTDPSIIIPSAGNTFTVNEGGYYRITVSDQYHTVVNYYNAGTLTNPLSNVVINPTASVIAGTSGFSFPIYNSGIKYPVSVKVERTDGQTLINHTAAEPLSLAGTYTYNFPMFVTWNSDPGVLGGIYDLPPGEYRFTLTDGCSNTKVFTATNATYANYTPTFSVTQGCNNSNSITFNLNKNGFAFGTNWSSGDVILYTKNSSGGVGTIVQQVSRTGNGSATFNNLPSGSYFVSYNGIGTGYSMAQRRTSPTGYSKEVVIPDYQNFTVSTGASICDTSNLNSGIVSAQITGGTYTYPITFSLFSTSNSAVPLATYVENDTSKVEHSFSNLATGNYFVRVASSCYSVDQNVSISTNVTAPRAIVSDPVICPLSPTTLGAISATNGLYDITWTNDADPNQTVIATGMPVVLSPAATIKYRATFKLKDFLACVNPPVYTSTVDVRVDANPDVSLAVSDIDLCLAPAIKTVTISNTQLDYKYEIVKMNGASFVPPILGTGNGGNLDIAFPSSFIFAAGTTLRVKTSNGANSKCSDYLTDLITISQSSPIKTLVVQSTDVCQGSASTIKVKASQSQIVYLIKKNGVPVSSIPTQIGNGSDLTFIIPSSQLAVGVNTFTVQASNSTCGTTDLDQVATINVTASPVASAGTAFIKTCIQNPSGKQIGMTGVSGITYSWSPSTGLDNANISNPVANPTTTTTYTLTAADGTCTATSTVKVTVITTVPSVNAGSDFTKSCSTNANGKSIGSIIQGQSVTYLWAPSSGLSSTTVATPTANPLITTTYTVTATETSSGCTASDEVIVTVDTTQPNSPSILSVIHPTCSVSTGSITVTSTGNIGDTYSIDNGITFQSSNIFNNVSVGTHLVKIKSGTNGCISNAVSVTINAQPLTPLAPTITAGGAVTFCTGGNVVLTSSSTSGNQWYRNGIAINGETNTTFTAIESGNYTVIVTNTEGCSSVASIGKAVTVNSNPTVVIDNGPKLAFANCMTAVTLTATAGYANYQWYKYDNSNIPVAIPNEVNYTFTTVIEGKYEVRVSDSNICSAISQPSQIVAPPSVISTTLSTCQGNTITINSDASQFVNPSYQWFRNGVAIVAATNSSVEVRDSGDYTVRVTEGGINSTSCSIPITFNPLPTVTAGTDFAITCVNNVGGLTIGEQPESGYNYLWTSDMGTAGLSNASIANPIANPSSTTSYKVKKTNTATGCWSEDTIEVTVDKSVPVANAGTDFIKTCMTNASGTQIGTPSVLGVSYSWSPSIGLDNASISNPIANPNNTTTYTLTATKDSTGCMATDTVVVTVDKSTVVSDAGADFTKTCNSNVLGNTIGVSATTGVTYLWSPSVGLSNTSIANPIANPNVTTTYTVTTTKDATGCTTTDFVTVTVEDVQIAVPTSNTVTASCPVETVDLSTLEPPTVNGIVYEWWTGTATTRAVQVTNPTTYAVGGKVYLWSKTNQGCYSASASEVTVTINSCCAASVGEFTQSFYPNYYGVSDLTVYQHINYTPNSVVRYVLVNTIDGKIKQINNLVPEFYEVEPGRYTINALVFGPTVIPTGIEIGNKLNQVQPLCGSIVTQSVAILDFCTTSSTWTNVITNTKQYALIDLTTNTFVSVSTTGVFPAIYTGVDHQIVGFNYTGTASGIVVGGTLSGVSASNLDITAGSVFTGCAPVTTQIEGILYNDKEKRCVEGLNTQEGLPESMLYAKLLDGNARVVSVSSLIQSPNYYFSFTTDLLDGTYTIIIDNNNDTNDTTATYPSSWRGNSQTFTIEFGQIVEYLSNTTNFVPMCMQSATDKPAPKRTSNLIGNTYHFCKGATTGVVNVDSISGATVNWYTTPTGGSSTTVAPTPNTSVVGITTFYVSQTLNGAESDRTEINIQVHALPEQPTAISGDNFVGSGTTQSYNVVNGLTTVTYNWILPTDWTGTSNTKDISVVVGTQDATIGVAAVSQYGCVSPVTQLAVRVVIEDDIEVYNSISPNADGVNDIFRIRNIDFYPENRVSIYNRWGVEVYSATSYGQGDTFFKGYSDGRSTINRDVELPEGTYFYILTYKNTRGIEKNRSGYLYIKQE